MPSETELQKGYNLATNDLATALMELNRINVHGHEFVDIKGLVARYKELRSIRFET